MCPYLTYEADVAGVCGMTGREVSASKVSGFCESDAYTDCHVYTVSSEEEEFELEEEY